MPLVIQLTRPRFRSLAIPLALFFCLSAFVYWYSQVRPYLSLPEAHLDAYSTLVGSDELGRIAQVGPSEGDCVKKGDLLFAFDRECLTAKRAQLQTSLQALQQQINLEKERMAKAMDSYLSIESGSDEAIHRQLQVMEESQMKSEEIASHMQILQEELRLQDLECKKGAFFAPFEGVILRRYKNEGATVNLGDAVYSLCDPKRCWVETQVPETKIHLVNLGTLAKVHFAAYPHREWVGKVSYISPSTSSKRDHLPLGATPAMIPIKISFETYDPLLRPGLFAKVDLKVH